MLLPPSDSKIIARRAEIVAALKKIVPDGVVADPSGLATFESDALSAYHQMPLVCVLPSNREQVSAILKYAGEEGVPIVPRGAGTSLSGGALPREDGILIGMGRMKRIIEIDYENGCVVVEPGVTNLNITKAVEANGFYYAPDPSSQVACTIGGNVAENSGGLHCLKYGLTTNNLLGVTLVAPGGEIVTLGGKSGAQGGLDLLGLVTGSEGLLGVVVEVVVKILRKAPVTRTLLASFDSVPAAGACVAAIIADGVVPAAMEFMDRRAAGAIEAYNHPGYPLDAEAILIIDADGVEADVAYAVSRVTDIVAQCGGKTVEATRAVLIGKIGENMTIRRFKRFSGDAKLTSYLHGTRIGVVVEYTGDDVAAKDVAMHVAAMKPVALSSSEVPAELIEKERNVAAGKAGRDRRANLLTRHPAIRPR